jgi:hypothetical protein
VSTIVATTLARGLGELRQFATSAAPASRASKPPPYTIQRLSARHRQPGRGATTPTLHLRWGPRLSWTNGLATNVQSVASKRSFRDGRGGRNRPFGSTATALNAVFGPGGRRSVTAPEETTSARSLNIPLNIPMTSEDALKRLSMSFGAQPRCPILTHERCRFAGRLQRERRVAPCDGPRFQGSHVRPLRHPAKCSFKPNH